MAQKYNTNVTLLRVLYVILEDLEKYLKDILIKFTCNIDDLKKDIFLLLNQSKKSTNSKKLDKSILTLINTSKNLMKQFDDEIITKEVLLLSFAFINDQEKEILLKYNITYNTLLEEIKKLGRVKKL